MALSKNDEFVLCVVPLPEGTVTGGETKGGRQVEYQSHFNFSIKWWFHPLWEPRDTAQATHVEKKFSSHYTSVAKGGRGALLWGAKLTAVCIRSLLQPCYSSTSVPTVPVGTSTSVPVPDWYAGTSAKILVPAYQYQTGTLVHQQRF